MQVGWEAGWCEVLHHILLHWLPACMVSSYFSPSICRKLLEKQDEHESALCCCSKVQRLTVCISRKRQII